VKTNGKRGGEKDDNSEKKGERRGFGSRRGVRPMSVLHTFVDTIPELDLRIQVGFSDAADAYLFTVQVDYFGSEELFDYISETEFDKVLEAFPWGEDTSVDWIAGKALLFLKENYNINPAMIRYNGVETEEDDWLTIYVQIWVEKELLQIDRLDYGYVARKMLDCFVKVFKNSNKINQQNAGA